MPADYVFILDRLRQWELRFYYPTHLTASVLAEIKNSFALQYGWEELERIVNKVVRECAEIVSLLID